MTGDRECTKKAMTLLIAICCEIHSESNSFIVPKLLGNQPYVFQPTSCEEILEKFLGYIPYQMKLGILRNSKDKARKSWEFL